MPTMLWKARRTTLTGGRSVAATVSSPCTVALVLWKASRESSRGSGIPYSTRPSLYQPRTWTGAPVVVWPSPSKAASLTGCTAATSRPFQSPTKICATDASAAAASATASAVRS
jgi:hypothetical protein